MNHESSWSPEFFGAAQQLGEALDLLRVDAMVRTPLPELVVPQDPFSRARAELELILQERRYHGEEYHDEREQLIDNFAPEGLQRLTNEVCDQQGQISPEMVKDLQRKLPQGFSINKEVDDGFIGFVEKYLQDEKFRRNMEARRILGLVREASPIAPTYQILTQIEQLLGTTKVNGINYIKPNEKFESQLTTLDFQDLNRTIIQGIVVAYRKCFAAMPDILIEERHSFALPKLMMVMGIATKNWLGLYGEQKGRDLLDSLGKDDDIEEYTVPLTIPFEETETAAQTILNLNDKLKDAIVFSTGWLSTSDSMVIDKICELGQNDNHPCSLAEVCDFVAKTMVTDGKRRVVAGVQGIGYQKKKDGWGTRLRAEIPSDYQYDVWHKISVDAKVLAADGINMYMFFGHSEGGWKAALMFELLGIYSHAWNLATLSAIIRKGAGRVTTLMWLLTQLNRSAPSAWLAHQLADIRMKILEKETHGLSIMKLIVGKAEGFVDETMVAHHKEVYASTPWQAIYKAMDTMTKGQASHNHPRVGAGQALPYEATWGSTYNATAAFGWVPNLIKFVLTGISYGDFFVQDDHIEARAADRDKDIMFNLGLAPDFNLPGTINVFVGGRQYQIPWQAQLSRHQVQRVSDAIRQQQRIACPPETEKDNHYQLADPLAAIAIFKEALTRAQQWQFRPRILDVAAAAIAGPVWIKPDISGDNLTNLEEAPLWERIRQGRPTAITVSLADYEQIRWLIDRRRWHDESRPRSLKERYHEQLALVAKVANVDPAVDGLAAPVYHSLDNLISKDEITKLPKRRENRIRHYLQSLIRPDNLTAANYNPYGELVSWSRRNWVSKLFNQVPDFVLARNAYKHRLGELVRAKQRREGLMEGIPEELMRDIDAFVDGYDEATLTRISNGLPETLGDAIFARFFAEQLRRVGGSIVFAREFNEIEKQVRRLVMANVDPNFDFDDPEFKKFYHGFVCPLLDNTLRDNEIYNLLSYRQRHRWYKQLLAVVEHQFD